MEDKSAKQILSDIEVHSSNAIRLLNRSHEIQMSALDMDNLDAYIVAMRRAVAFQELSIREMQKAANLQCLLSRRQLDYLINQKLKFGLF